MTVLFDEARWLLAEPQPLTENNRRSQSMFYSSHCYEGGTGEFILMHD